MSPPNDTQARTRPVGRLEAMRRERGLRQVDLAQAAGVSATSVSIAEAGYVPSPRLRARIAAALDVPESELWPHKGDPVSSKLYRKTYMKIEGQRQMIDTGPARYLIVRSEGSESLCLSAQETAAKPDQVLEAGEEIEVSSRAWLWSPGRARIEVREYHR